MSAILDHLVGILQTLPGIGPRSARRIAYHLLYQHKEQAKLLAHALEQGAESIQHCQICNHFSDAPICNICMDSSRDKALVCVVEMPIDVHTMEQSHTYQGQYFVLMGRLSPLDKVHVEDIAFNACLERCRQNEVQEVILATSFTAEGETTAYYLGQALRESGKKISRLASGIPSGSELEYVDTYTIAQALHARKKMDET